MCILNILIFRSLTNNFILCSILFTLAIKEFRTRFRQHINEACLIRMKAIRCNHQPRILEESSKSSPARRHPDGNNKLCQFNRVTGYFSYFWSRIFLANTWNSRGHSYFFLYLQHFTSIASVPNCCEQRSVALGWSANLSSKWSVSSAGRLCDNNSTSHGLFASGSSSRSFYNRVSIISLKFRNFWKFTSWDARIWNRKLECRRISLWGWIVLMSLFLSPIFQPSIFK